MRGGTRTSGIDAIKKVPWGTHLCQFYESRKDLLDILVPYFKAGLENNEFCVWVTSEPLYREDAEKALCDSLSHFDKYIRKGQIEIVPHNRWYLESNTFDCSRVLNGWSKKLVQALSQGYDGMRVSGNVSWIEQKDWMDIFAYEEEVHKTIAKYPIIALCTYPVRKCGIAEVIGMGNNHQFTLIKRTNEWKAVPSNVYRKIRERELMSGQRRKDIHII